MAVIINVLCGNVRLIQFQEICFIEEAKYPSGIINRKESEFGLQCSLRNTELNIPCVI